MKRLCVLIATLGIIVGLGPPAHATAGTEVEAIRFGNYSHAGTCTNAILDVFNTHFSDGTMSMNVKMWNGSSAGHLCVYLGFVVVWEDCNGSIHTSSEVGRFNLNPGDAFTWGRDQDCGYQWPDSVGTGVRHVLWRVAGQGLYGVNIWNPPQDGGVDKNTTYDSGSCAFYAGGNCAPFGPIHY